MAAAASANANAAADPFSAGVPEDELSPPIEVTSRESKLSAIKGAHERGEIDSAAVTRHTQGVEAAHQVMDMPDEELLESTESTSAFNMYGLGVGGGFGGSMSKGSSDVSALESVTEFGAPEDREELLRKTNLAMQNYSTAEAAEGVLEDNPNADLKRKDMLLSDFPQLKPQRRGPLSKWGGEATSGMRGPEFKEHREAMEADMDLVEGRIAEMVRRSEGHPRVAQEAYTGALTRSMQGDSMFDARVKESGRTGRDERIAEVATSQLSDEQIVDAHVEAARRANDPRAQRAVPDFNIGLFTEGKLSRLRDDLTRRGSSPSLIARVERAIPGR